MSDLVFLIINASLVCFIASFLLLKVFRSKILIVCFVLSPFVLIPYFEGNTQGWLLGYVFTLQYGGLGVVIAILLFELDKITRARKLRYLTSAIARMIIAISSFYLFVFTSKRLIAQNDTVSTSIEYASVFGLLKEDDLALVDNFGRFFTATGALICTLIIILCLSIIVFNKFRAFKEVQRIWVK